MAAGSCRQRINIMAVLPPNTPAGARIYAAGNFNNWQANNPDFELKKQTNGQYRLSFASDLDTVEFKLCRGNWTSVESNNCGHFLPNHHLYATPGDTLRLTVRGWEDAAPYDCPMVYIRVNKLPPATPIGDVVYATGTFNDWDPNDRNYALKVDPGGYYYIGLPNTDKPIEFKLIRGDWAKVECSQTGASIENRIYPSESDTMQVTVKGWSDQF